MAHVFSFALKVMNMNKEYQGKNEKELYPYVELLDTKYVGKHSCCGFQDITCKDVLFTILLGSSSSQKVHKIISTHLLTLLIIGAILHLEQRKGDQSEEILRKEVSF